MKKLVIVVIALAAAAAIAYYAGLFTRESAQAAGAPGQPQGQAGGRGGNRQGGAGQGGGNFGGGRNQRGPLTVELATVSRGTVAEAITVVGNLIGSSTVSVVPRVAGRLQAIYVQLGDRVA